MIKLNSLVIGSMPLALQPVATWTFGDWLIAIVIIAACIGVLYVALNYFGIQIPQWLLKIIGICIVALVAVVAIRFLLSL